MNREKLRHYTTVKTTTSFYLNLTTLNPYNNGDYPIDCCLLILRFQPKSIGRYNGQLSLSLVYLGSCKVKSSCVIAGLF